MTKHFLNDIIHGQELFFVQCFTALVLVIFITFIIAEKLYSSEKRNPDTVQPSPATENRNELLKTRIILYGRYFRDMLKDWCATWLIGYKSKIGDISWRLRDSISSYLKDTIKKIESTWLTDYSHLLALKEIEIKLLNHMLDIEAALVSQKEALVSQQQKEIDELMEKYSDALLQKDQIVIRLNEKTAFEIHEKEVKISRQDKEISELKSKVEKQSVGIKWLSQATCELELIKFQSKSRASEMAAKDLQIEELNSKISVLRNKDVENTEILQSLSNQYYAKDSETNMLRQQLAMVPSLQNQLSSKNKEIDNLKSITWGHESELKNIRNLLSAKNSEILHLRSQIESQEINLPKVDSKFNFFSFENNRLALDGPDLRNYLVSGSPLRPEPCNSGAQPTPVGFGDSSSRSQTLSSPKIKSLFP